MLVVNHATELTSNAILERQKKRKLRQDPIETKSIVRLTYQRAGVAQTDHRQEGENKEDTAPSEARVQKQCHNQRSSENTKTDCQGYA